MPKIPLGLVGVGKIAVDQHFPSIVETGLFDLIGIVSRRGIQVPGARTFATQAQMFAALPQLVAVANCTPPAVRHGAVAEALRAGKHVLMEKPPTASVAQLADLQSLAQRAQRSLFATWHSQYNQAVDMAAAMLLQRAPLSAQIIWKEDVRRWHPGQEWIWQQGGFGVFDPGINALSILVKILPEPVFVHTATLNFPQNRDTPIAASLVLKPADGSGLQEVAAEFDWRQEGNQTWDIAIQLQDGGQIILTHGGTRLQVDRGEAMTQPDSEYRQIYRHFGKLIETGQSHIDTRPLHLVADAMLIGRREVTAAFDW